MNRKRESLNTRNRREKKQILLARNQASDHPQVGMALAKAYLAAQDPELPVILGVISVSKVHIERAEPDPEYGHDERTTDMTRWGGLVDVVEVRKTEPLEKLVWATPTPARNLTVLLGN